MRLSVNSARAGTVVWLIIIVILAGALPAQAVENSELVEGVVGMLQSGGHLDFTPKAVLTHPGRHLRRQHLDDHLSVEIDFPGQEHPAHAATG